MIWDVATIRALNEIVNKKYDELRGELDRQGCTPYQVALRWKEYLDSHGIDRRPMQLPRRRNGGAPRVFIECPWSLHNSTPGSVYTKSELFFPMDLAEKIVILGAMP